MKYLWAIIFFIAFLDSIFGQYTLNESAIFSATVDNVEEINTGELEFSPLPFGNSILFIQPEQRRNKYDRKINEGYFKVAQYNLADNGVLLNLDKLNSYNQHIGPMAYDRHNQLLYYTISKPGKKGRRKAFNRIQVAKASSTTLEPTSTEILPDIDHSTQHPTLSMNGREMIFSANGTDAQGGYDLYSTMYSDTGWTTPIPLPNTINSFGNEAFPFLIRDSILLFASNGRLGHGGFDIFISIKDGDQWQEAVNLGQSINSTGDDFGLTMTDLRNGYFSSNRAGGKGKDDIYHLSLESDLCLHVQPTEILLKPKREIYDFLINVKSIDQKPIADALVSLIPINDQEGLSFKSIEVESVDTAQGAQKILMNVIPQEDDIKTKVSNEQGQVLYNLSSERKYFVNVQHEDYLSFNLMINGSERIKEIDLELDIDQKKLEPTPAEKKEKISELKKIYVFDQLYYQLGSATITDRSQEQLNRLIQFLKDYPETTVDLIGHTDSKGNGDSNLTLSLRRAQQVKSTISTAGIQEGRINVLGMGERNIRNHCTNGVYCTEEEHQYNRRTEIRINYPD